MRPAAAPLALLATTLVLAVVLLVAFDPGVQKLGPEELVERQDDARAFLIADYVFVLVYGVLSPIAIWRFGRALAGGQAPAWITATTFLLLAAGLVDACENTLLLSATESVDESAVDAAHSLEIPKVALFVLGALGAIAANVRAARALRS